MKLFTFKVDNKRLLVFFLCLLTGFLILLDFLSANKFTNASGIDDNASRVDFIKSLGVIPEDELFSQKEIIIPKKFSKVYLKYNELQKQAAYDLTKHSGEKATVYTYCVPNFRGTTAYVNLIIIDGVIIGGDISAVEIDGFMLPLRKIE